MKSSKRITAAAVTVAILCVVPLAVATDKVLSVDQTPVIREVPVSPDVLLNQPPNQVNGIFSDIGCAICGTGVQVIADNFVVSTGGLGVDITQLTIWGGRYPGNSAWPGSAFEVRFHQDAAAAPGTVVCTYSGVIPTATQTGVVLFGVNEYLVDFVLPSPCTLADGTYWLQTYTDTSSSPDDFFWEVGDVDPVSGIVGSVWATAAPPTTWNVDVETDLSLQLQGTVVPVELQTLSVE